MINYSFNPIEVGVVYVKLFNLGNCLLSGWEKGKGHGMKSSSGPLRKIEKKCRKYAWDWRNK